MAQLTHKDFTGNMGSGLHGDVARRAAFDLCRLVEDVSPVKIEACEGGHNLVWKSSEGGRVVIKLSEFMRQRGGQDTQGLESHVVSTLKSRAGLSCETRQGFFSFISSDSEGGADSFDVFIESYTTEAGEALALTVEAAREAALPDGILYRNLD